jgi:hypothetical protein
MKQCFLVCFVLALILLFAVPCVSAEGITVQQNSVTVRCDSCVPGQWYTFFVFRGDTPDRDQLLFIDQLAADSSGTVSVTFIHANLPKCTFFVGGQFSEQTSPRIIGSFTPYQAGGELPGALQVIGEEAFAGSAFPCIVIGSSVTDIESRAFANCSQLHRAMIPGSVKRIAADAFEGCDSLTIACPQNSVAYDFAVSHGYVVEIIK